MRLWRFAPVAVAALALTACGGSSGGALSLDPVAKAADKTSSVGSEKVSMTGTMDLSGQTIRMTGGGAVDMDAHTGTFNLDMQPTGQNASLHIDEVMQGTTLYMKMPQSMTKLPKPWVKLDLQQAGKKLGVDMSAMTSNQNDPSQMLDYLRSSGNVTKLGQETVRGVDTTHYRAVVDLRKAADAAPPDKRAVIRKNARRLIELTGVRKYPIEVWIDAKSLVRRMKFTMNYGRMLAGAKFTMTMDLYDFGTRVNVQAPPADQVVDISQLSGAGG